MYLTKYKGKWCPPLGSLALSVLTNCPTAVGPNEIRGDDEFEKHVFPTLEQTFLFPKLGRSVSSV
jgi:hypothetical protein